MDDRGPIGLLNSTVCKYKLSGLRRANTKRTVSEPRDAPWGRPCAAPHYTQLRQKHDLKLSDYKYIIGGTNPIALSLLKFKQI